MTGPGHKLMTILTIHMAGPGHKLMTTTHNSYGRAGTQTDNHHTHNQYCRTGNQLMTTTLKPYGRAGNQLMTTSLTIHMTGLDPN